ncbi:MAG: sensor histidine kinase, partial [Lachnospiraceae bacterium]|nr:sensor histidine kinase [Lachnospiraceae bacterium]
MKTVIRKSFKRELFLCFIVVALVPLVITGCFLVSTLKARLSRDYEEKTQEQLVSVEKRMTDVFDEMEQVAEEIMSDAVIVDGITQTDSWLKNKAYNRLYEKTQNLREVAWFHVYDAQGVCSLSTSPQGAGGELPAYWGLLKLARTHSQEMILRRASWDQSSE